MFIKTTFIFDWRYTALKNHWNKLKIGLLAQSTKQPFSNSDPWKSSNFESWGLNLVTFKKSVTISAKSSILGGCLWKLIYMKNDFGANVTITRNHFRHWLNNKNILNSIGKQLTLCSIPTPRNLVRKQLFYLIRHFLLYQYKLKLLPYMRPLILSNTVNVSWKKA